MDEIDVHGKTVLCRVDINQPVDRATDTLKSTARIEACVPTIRELSDKGAKVVLIGRTASKLEVTAAAIAEAGGVCRIETASVTDEPAIQAIADKVAAEWGPCRFLVNGAGGNQPAAVADRLAFDPAELEGPMAEGKKGWWDVDLDVFESVLMTNTMGTVIPSRVFAKQMAAAGGGAIINFGSMNTYRPLTRVAAYAMSKAAIANWTQFLAQYLAPAKIRVNAIAPGFFVNERSKKILCTPDGGLTPRGEQVMAHTPAGRFGEAAELLGCVEWLLNDEKAGFVTGITVPVDGGFLASAGV
jgi:NAD(P)-dependent dehydrogenase (short-subunit alcohol dehydrogenase family)